MTRSEYMERLYRLESSVDRLVAAGADAYTYTPEQQEALDAAVACVELYITEAGMAKVMSLTVALGNLAIDASDEVARIFDEARAAYKERSNP